MNNNLNGFLNHTAFSYGVSVEELTGKSRKEKVAFIRHYAMYHMRMNTEATLEDIGKVIGNRTPATVSYGVQRISDIVFKKRWNV